MGLVENRHQESNKRKLSGKQIGEGEKEQYVGRWMKER